MTLPARVPLSVVIITLNAERTLAKSLASVADWADEIILVDSGSTDATLSIARKFECRVYHREFDGFGTQKQYAVEQATHDWVLVLDADEIVSKPLALEIRELFTKGTPIMDGYALPRNLVFLGRVLRYSGQHRQPILRLFDRRQGCISPTRVHESVQVAGPVGRFSAPLIHDSYGSLHEYVVKMNQYTTLSAGEMAARQKKANLPLQGLRFLFTFLKIYIFRRGVLDGYPGFVWALLSAVYPVIKYTKLHEIQDAKAHDRVEPALAFSR
ncbi:glycosyltransferase family 2 protein [Larkinella soli]|uniref:glycosyltransferase family 2 protein n=1 Tax=Larkinella soli TaxID=1770527 RepID=UPI000FFB59AF|nr:glycosyltransferase family 2 protein [Larkinella soli]